MNNHPKAEIGRREVFRLLAIGVAAAATGTVATTGGAAQAKGFPDKSRAHYQADAAEVQTFYRVNSYPAK
jgi:hypothetical protein